MGTECMRVSNGDLKWMGLWMWRLDWDYGALEDGQNPFIGRLTALIRARSLLNHHIRLFCPLFNYSLEHFVAYVDFKGSDKISSARIYICAVQYICMCVCVQYTHVSTCIRGKGKRGSLSGAHLQLEAKNGLKVLTTVFFFPLLKVKQTVKYLNDNAGVTLNPFSRFINWSRKNEGNQSEKFKPLNRGGGREREREMEERLLWNLKGYLFEVLFRGACPAQTTKKPKKTLLHKYMKRLQEDATSSAVAFGVRAHSRKCLVSRYAFYLWLN